MNNLFFYIFKIFEISHEIDDFSLIETLSVVLARSVLLRGCWDHFRMEIHINLLINCASSGPFVWAFRSVRWVVIAINYLIWDISRFDIVCINWSFKYSWSFQMISLRIAMWGFFLDILHHFGIPCQNLRGYIWSCRFHRAIKAWNLWHLEIIKIQLQIDLKLFDFQNILLQLSVGQRCLVCIYVEVFIHLSSRPRNFKFIIIYNLNWVNVLFNDDWLNSRVLRV